ncbi:MAG: hypothetical protein ABSA97_06035 [Verrucomicrobiia bacterium]
MSEQKYKGSTRAAWLALRGKGGGPLPPSEVEIQDAILWFEEQARMAQDQKSGKQFRITQWIALSAVLISILGWLFPRLPREASLPHELRSRVEPPLTTNLPTGLFSPATNSAKATSQKTNNLQLQP